MRPYAATVSTSSSRSAHIAQCKLECCGSVVNCPMTLTCHCSKIGHNEGRIFGILLTRHKQPFPGHASASASDFQLATYFHSCMFQQFSKRQKRHYCRMHGTVYHSIHCSVSRARFAREQRSLITWPGSTGTSSQPCCRHPLHLNDSIVKHASPGWHVWIITCFLVSHSCLLMTTAAWNPECAYAINYDVIHHISGLKIS